MSQALPVVHSICRKTQAPYPTMPGLSPCPCPSPKPQLLFCPAGILHSNQAAGLGAPPAWQPPSFCSPPWLPSFMAFSPAPQSEAIPIFNMTPLLFPTCQDCVFLYQLRQGLGSRTSGHPTPCLAQPGPRKSILIQKADISKSPIQEPRPVNKLTLEPL